jgi:hypothetical protein
MSPLTYPFVAPGAIGRSGGFRGAACGAREKDRREAASSDTSGTGSERAKGRERSGEEAAREHLAPGGEAPQGIGPMRNRKYDNEALRVFQGGFP